MTATPRRIVVLLAALLVASLLVTAPASADHIVFNCGGGEVSGQGVSEHRVMHDELWIPIHENECPGVAGALGFTVASDVDAIEDFQNRRTMFLGLNAPLRPEEWAVAVSSRNNPGARSSTIHHLPMFIGGFVVTANLRTCPSPNGGVKLDPTALSAIYGGVATTWGDPVIVQVHQDNLVLANCTEAIQVSVRDGAAWSNLVLKDYMSKRNPAFIPYKDRERLGSWPPGLDDDCRGFDDTGMRICGQHAGAISYMPYRTAKLAGLPIVKLANGQNPSQYPSPAVNDTDTWPSRCPAAVPSGSQFPPTLADWSTFSMTYGNGYPLCGLSFAIAFQTPRAANGGWPDFQARSIKNHLTVMVSDDTQLALPSRGYAPLPQTALDLVRGSVAAIVTD